VFSSDGLKILYRSLIFQPLPEEEPSLFLRKANDHEVFFAILFSLWSVRCKDPKLLNQYVNIRVDPLITVVHACFIQEA
jgi:hypothetical protein